MSATLIFAILAVGLQDAGTGEGTWKTYVSKEGQFLVDFPVAPTLNSNSTEEGPGGKSQIILVGCDTPAVGYAAEKIVMSTPVVRGAEDLVLNSFRDYFARKYKGKLLTEKKVRLEGRPGRDFTVRAQLTPGGPVSTIRIRMFVAGQAIFALVAESAANRELPADVGKFFGSFALGTVRAKKLAATGEETARDIPGWGKAIDRDADCKFSSDGPALVLEAPGNKPHGLSETDGYNAPRVLREVEGDFLFQVKVVGDFKPGGKSTTPKFVPFNGGGVLLWRDSDNMIRLERAAMLKGGKLATFAIFEEREGGSNSASHNGPLTPGTAYLRLERRGPRVLGFTSKDGSHWVALRPIDTVWPSKVRVGVSAINNTDTAFNVRFEEPILKTRSGDSAAKP